MLHPIITVNNSHHTNLKQLVDFPPRQPIAYISNHPNPDGTCSLLAMSASNECVFSCCFPSEDSALSCDSFHQFIK